MTPTNNTAAVAPSGEWFWRIPHPALVWRPIAGERPAIST